MCAYICLCWFRVLKSMDVWCVGWSDIYVFAVDV